MLKHLDNFNYSESIKNSKSFKHLGGNIFKSLSTERFFHFKLLRNNYFDMYQIYVDTNHVSDVYFEYDGEPFEKKHIKNIKSIRYS
jgi:hypothetical protein